MKQKPNIPSGLMLYTKGLQAKIEYIDSIGEYFFYHFTREQMVVIWCVSSKPPGMKCAHFSDTEGTLKYSTMLLKKDLKIYTNTLSSNISTTSSCHSTGNILCNHKGKGPPTENIGLFSYEKQCVHMDISVPFGVELSIRETESSSFGVFFLMLLIGFPFNKPQTNIATTTQRQASLSLQVPTAKASPRSVQYEASHWTIKTTRFGDVITSCGPPSWAVRVAIIQCVASWTSAVLYRGGFQTHTLQHHCIIIIIINTNFLLSLALAMSS